MSKNTWKAAFGRPRGATVGDWPFCGRGLTRNPTLIRSLGRPTKNPFPEGAGIYLTRLEARMDRSAMSEDIELGARSAASAFWGWNQRRFAATESVEHHRPHQVTGLSGVAAVAAGSWHTVVLKNDGTVWAWGDNTSGQIGDGNSTNRPTPTQVPGLTGVTAIAAEGAHTVALKSDGTVWSWGLDLLRLPVDGTTQAHFKPVQVTNLSGVTAIAAGDYCTLALKNDGTVWAWGENDHGQLGDGSTANRYAPGRNGRVSRGSRDCGWAFPHRCAEE